MESRRSMLLSTALVALAVAVAPGQAPSDDDAEVLIPGTEINVCVVATVEDLMAVRADAQVLLEGAGVEFADLKALCDNASVSAPEVPVVPEPPASGGGDGGGSGDQVDVVPSGAPETGDGSTEVPLTLVLGGFGALVTAGITAVGLGARRTLPTRR